jgi:hypothetical protein
VEKLANYAEKSGKKAVLEMKNEARTFMCFYGGDIKNYALYPT